MSPNRSLHRLLAAGLAALFLLTPVQLRAVVDDAHSAAMALASSHVPKGFRVREDYWKGSMKPGETRQVKAQLFRGNEYWFWLGLDADKVDSMSITITDMKGKPLQVETANGNLSAAARVLPPRTGTYIISFTVKATGSEAMDWALAYGYR